MLGILETILYFVIVIAVLVFVHELGHFLAAKWCGIRADIFSIGMGPRLFGWNKPLGFTFGKIPDDLDLKGGTDYRVAALPIGGYVKIAGMVDESMDVGYAQSPPKPDEFRSKNAFQKAFVISAGVIMNMILAIIVFAALSYSQPRELWLTTTLGPVANGTPAEQAGFHEGDVIRKINDSTVTTFQDISRQIHREQKDSNLRITFERKGETRTINVLRLDIPEAEGGENPAFFPNATQEEVKINRVLKNKPADSAGFEQGDVITSIDGNPIRTHQQIQGYMSKRKSTPVNVVVRRDSALVTKTVRTDTAGQIGVELSQTFTGPTRQIRTGVWESLKMGFTASIAQARGIFGLIGNLISGQARLKDSVGGPVAIAAIAKSTADRGLVQFLGLLATLSVTLAVMNILPIPALDGGHLVFIIIEGIIRREVPLKVRMAIQQAGVIILLLFMTFVVINDISRI